MRSLASFRPSNKSPVPFTTERGRRSIWNLPGQQHGDYVTQMTTYGDDGVVFPIVNRLMSATGGSVVQEMCSKPDIQKTGDTITVDSTCKIGPYTTSSTILDHAYVNHPEREVVIVAETHEQAAQQNPDRDGGEDGGQPDGEGQGGVHVRPRP